MYDIELYVPADTDIPFIYQRLKDFKKYGLWNAENHKIKLIFGTHQDNQSDWLLEGWPKNIDAEIFPCKYKHIAQRNYCYYDEYLKPDSALWYIRIDEDSMTDITTLMKNLNLYFDPEKEYHICGSNSNDMCEIDTKILNSLGYGHIAYPNANHEHEISITSKEAIKKIFQNPASKRYFSIRKLISEGYGDHGLSWAAKMNKIYLTSVFWLEKHPWLDCFSALGGHLSHIHWTGRDKSPQVYNWLDSLNEDQSKSKEFDGEYIYTKPKHSETETIFVKLENNSINQISSNKRIGIFATNKNNELTIFVNDWGNYKNLLEFKANEDKLICKNKEEYVLIKIK